MRSRPIQLTIVASGALFFLFILVMVIIPLVGHIRTTRRDIDAARSAIASLEKQQHDIEAVSKGFSEILDQEKYAAQLFLTDDRSVEFFNAVDEAFTSSGIEQGTITIDEPNRQQQFQLVGVHLVFSGTYRAIASFFHSLPTIPVYITVDSVQIGGSESNPTFPLRVTADGFIPFYNST